MLKDFYKDSKIEHIISDLKIDNPEALPFSGANIFFDMAIDNNENIYLAYYGNRQIIKINPSGKKDTGDSHPPKKSMVINAVINNTALSSPIIKSRYGVDVYST